MKEQFRRTLPVFAAIAFVAVLCLVLAGLGTTPGAASVASDMRASGQRDIADASAVGDEASSAGAAGEPAGVASDVAHMVPGSEPGPVADEQGDEPRFTMPSGAQYEPDTALVRVREGATSEEINAVLANTEGVIAREVDASELEAGYVLVGLDEGVSVEDAVNSLCEAGDAIAGAQPNYRYEPLEAATVVDLQARLGASVAQASGDEGWRTDDSGGEPPSPPSDGGRVESEAAGGPIALEAGDLATVVPTADGQQGEAVPPDAPGDGQATGDDGGESAGMPQATPTEALADALSVNDPRAASQWALSSMHVYEAWAMAQGGRPKSGKAVTVAVLDTGFDITHGDLKANLVAPYNAHTHTSTASDMAAGAQTANPNHGTHVAGIISAVANNGLGVAGVSYNAKVMPIRTTDDRGYAYSSDLVGAFTYLIRRVSTYNVRVVNLSMGIASSRLSSDDAFLRMVDQAYEAGIVTVAAAGNATLATPPFDCYPSDYSTIVSVINLSRSGTSVRRSSSSNYNGSGETDKDISAPGTDILSTIPNDRYGTMSGTSMSAPAVAGVLALEFAANPGLSAAQAKQLLFASAQDLGPTGFDEEYGYGEADAAKAVRLVQDDLREEERRAQEEALRRAQEEEQSRQQVAAVRAQIDALPSVANVTLADRAVVVAARTAYDALTDAQRQGVDASALLAVEQRIATLERVELQRTRGLSIAYRAHVQNYDWRPWARDGQTAGVTGQSLRLEALCVDLGNQVLTGSVYYRAHVQDAGWQEWARDGAQVGLVGQQKRLEAIQVVLSGELADYYDVWYRVHVQHFGWMGWAKNGASAGTAAYAYRLEAVEMRVLPKGSDAPGATGRAFRSPVTYQTHVQGIGWQDAVCDGALSGTTGQARRVEALRLAVPGAAYAGSIVYRAYVQDDTWGGWVRDGATAGTTGQSKRVEALQIVLTGELANHYDVWYRVHAQHFGWMGWAKNGASAGTAGYAYRLESVQVCLLEKNESAPGNTRGAFYSR